MGMKARQTSSAGKGANRVCCPASASPRQDEDNREASGETGVGIVPMNGSSRGTRATAEGDGFANNADLRFRRCAADQAGEVAFRWN